MHKLLLGSFLLIGITSLGQVKLQTGAVDAAFPLFQHNDTKSRLGTAVSLNYVSGNGITVNEVASCVGTGWALQAGGVITRIQNGEPDDQKFNNGANKERPFKEETAMGIDVDYYFPDGYMYSTVSPQDEIPGEAAFVPYYPSSVGTREYKANFDDREQDIYAFDFNGKSGQFVIGKNKVPEILNDSKLKITFTEANMEAQSIRTQITSFTITDESGLKYKFSELQLNEVFKYKDAPMVNGFIVLKGFSLASYAIKKVVTKWFLKEIENPFTSEKIFFNYENYSVDIDGARHISSQSSNGRSSKQVLIDRIKFTAPKITSIVFPDLYKVEFNYMSSERFDVIGDRALSDVKVSYNNNLLYSYQFHYGYFYKDQVVPYNYSFTAQDKQYVRFCLTDFKKTVADGVSLPPHVFSYYTPNNDTDPGCFPKPFSQCADHWGYYVQTAVFIGEDMDGNPAGSLSDKGQYLLHHDSPFGLLSKITYPEGGSLEYDFEINKSEASAFLDKYAGGHRVAKTTLYDGVSHANDVIKLYKYVKPDGVSSSAWGYETPKYTEIKGLRQYKTGGSVNAGIGVKEFAASFTETVLQTQKDAFFAPFVKDQITSASAKSAFWAMAVFFVVQIYDIAFSDGYKDFDVTIIKNDNFNLKNPLPLQYPRVEVVDAIFNNGVYQGSNGKIVYEFTSDQHFALRDPGPYTDPYSSKQRFAYWQYGLPKMTTVYNSVNQPVKKIENFYNQISRQIQDANFVSKSWHVNKMLSAAYNFYKPAFNDVKSFVTNDVPFYPIQGRVELSKTEETIYNSNGQSTVKEISYTYSPSNYLPRTISKKDSKGDFAGTTTYYTSDYNITGAINNMKGSNIVNTPVSVFNWVKSGQAGAVEQLLNATVNEYASTSNNDFRPVQVYKSELAAPLSNTVAIPSNFDAGNFKGYSYLKPQTAQVYLDGNLIQTIGLNGMSTKSAIYGYNKRKVVAEVVNASVDEIRYTSFESDITGWSYGSQGVVNEFCPTGKSCFDLSRGTVESAEFGRVKPFIVSLWSTGSQIAVSLVSGGVQTISPSVSAPVINGWTYYEFVLPAGALAKVSVSGNGLIDELRCYPKGGRMKTYTYDPAIGMTSECDVNNKIIRYEYDGFGRLIKIKDQYNNLVKTYEYFFKQ